MKEHALGLVIESTLQKVNRSDIWPRASISSKRKDTPARRLSSCVLYPRALRHFSTLVSYVIAFVGYFITSLASVRSYISRNGVFLRDTRLKTFAKYIVARRSTHARARSSSRARLKRIAVGREAHKPAFPTFISAQHQEYICYFNEYRGSTCLYTFNEAYANKSR